MGRRYRSFADLAHNFVFAHSSAMGVGCRPASWEVQGGERPRFSFTVPLVKHCTMRMGTRVRTTAFGAEKALTNRLVLLDVDVVLFWMVLDAEKACAVVDDYSRLTLCSAQTILRDVIGCANAAEVTAATNWIVSSRAPSISSAIRCSGLSTR